jgi:hypothetical protein
LDNKEDLVGVETEDDWTVVSAHDSLVFSDFISKFEKQQYPYVYKYGINRISYFDENILNTFDIEYAKEEIERTNSLSIELINKYLVDVEESNPLTDWIKLFLPNIDDDWYAIEPGVSIENNNNFLTTIYTYEQTSAINGGYWTVWLVDFTKIGVVNKVTQVGVEGFYKSTLSNDDPETGNYSYRRYYENIMLKLNFESEDYIESCQFQWTEIEGDIDTNSVNYIKIPINNNLDTLDLLLEDKMEECEIIIGSN